MQQQRMLSVQECQVQRISRQCTMTFACLLGLHLRTLGETKPPPEMATSIVQHTEPATTALNWGVQDSIISCSLKLAQPQATDNLQIISPLLDQLTAWTDAANIDWTDSWSMVEFPKHIDEEDIGKVVAYSLGLPQLQQLCGLANAESPREAYPALVCLAAMVSKSHCVLFTKPKNKLG